MPRKENAFPVVIPIGCCFNRQWETLEEVMGMYQNRRGFAERVWWMSLRSTEYGVRNKGSREVSNYNLSLKGIGPWWDWRCSRSLPSGWKSRFDPQRKRLWDGTSFQDSTPYGDPQRVLCTPSSVAALEHISWSHPINRCAGNVVPCEPWPFGSFFQAQVEIEIPILEGCRRERGWLVKWYSPQMLTRIQYWHGGEFCPCNMLYVIPN